MGDIWSKAKRSEVMSRIKSKGNLRTEVCLVKALREEWILGWRRHQNLQGKPDFVFSRYKLAVFVDGCFWHGCPRCYRRSKSNQEFWDEKVRRNMARDRRVTRDLKASGWRVVRIWEHALHNNAKRCVSKITHVIEE